MATGTGQRRQPAPPAVTVHDAAGAALVLRLSGSLPGPGVTLLSAPGAAATLGAPWFLAILAAARAAAPGVPHDAVLDCAAAPGLALAALRAGLRDLVLDPRCPGFAAVASAAGELSARLRPARPASLDLGHLDLTRVGGRARLAAWLAGAG